MTDSEQLRLYREQEREYQADPYTTLETRVVICETQYKEFRKENYGMMMVGGILFTVMAIAIISLWIKLKGVDD